MNFSPQNPRLPAATLRAASLLLLAPLAHAAESPPTPSTPSTAAYVDQPIINSSIDYFPSSSSFSSFSGSSSFGLNNTYSRTISFRRLRIFFPPNPPALGQTLGTSVVVRPSDPANLRHYISEPFFPGLSSLLYDESLSRRRQQHIDDYRGEKQKILAELRAKLEELKGADASRREQELASLARDQSPRIRAVEATADDIRNDFIRGGLFQSSVDWNDSRDWRLGDNLRYESYLDEFKVARASIYFQNGLSLPQRRLLRELSIELAAAGSDPTADISLDRPAPYISFSPDTARIHLPYEMPASLTRKLDDYREKKNALKKELRDTLYKQDRAWFDFSRVAALRLLAEQQAPRYDELEVLAEDIRRDLSTLPYPDEPKQSPLPPAIAERVNSYLHNKSEFQRTLLAKRDEIRAALPLDRVEWNGQSGAVGILIVASRRSSKAIDEKRESIRAELVSFNREQSNRKAALSREQENLRAEILKASEASSQGSKSVERLLSEYSRSFAIQENWNRYREYRTAVLTPGLSPEQRRLLYDAALEDLQAGMSYSSI